MTDRINEGIFSSNVDAWATPQSFMDVLRREFTFDLDPCCLPSSAKAPRYFTPLDDGLAQPWEGTVFMNPPYGRSIKLWVEKARRSAEENGATVVCLIPARTDTDYWHEHVLCAAAEVRFIRGRLHFGGGHERTAHNAPFPSAVVIFRPDVGGPPILTTIERSIGQRLHAIDRPRLAI